MDHNSITSRFKKVGANFLCPAHTDKRPSLSITDQGEKTLIHCFAGCTKDSPLPVLEQVGLTVSDLYRNGNGQSENNILATYYYKDATGDYLYRKHKTVNEKFPYWLERYEDGGWVKKLSDRTRRVLYRLPEIIEGIKTGETVYFPEGEKDVETLARQNLIATTNYDGANGKWRDEYGDVLEGASVVLLPDNDTAGYDRVERFAAKLKGVAASVKVVHLYGLKEKEDITDWIVKYGRTVDELQHLVEETPEWTPAEPKQKPEITTEEKIYPLTDLGNAELFAETHRGKVRYCYEDKTWYVFDGTRWVRDAGNMIKALAKEIPRLRLKHASECSSDEERKQLTRWAQQSESEFRIKAMLSLAQSESGIPIKINEFDRDKFLMNLLNGTMDLRAGEFREHKAGDLITKITDIEFSYDADCPYWDRLLNMWFRNDQELIDYIQRVVGYTLTGNTDEHALFILFGNGNNGKSTFIQWLLRLYGEYGHRTNSEMLLMKRNESVPSDIAALRGKRFVYASETDEGRRLAVARIKDLTGGDTVSARFLFREFFEFTPECKIFLSTNNRPKVRENSTAIWRRIKLIPFTYQIPESEQIPRREIDEKLEDELPGILHWAITGYNEWQKRGLCEPHVVKEATDEYRKDEDIFKTFIADRCITQEDAKVGNKVIWDTYLEYCKDSGERAMSRKDFKAAMEREGFEQKRGTGRFWQGVGVLNE